MMILRKTFLAAALGLSFAATVPAGAVLAQGDVAAAKSVVDAAKAKGIVGEQGDGLLGFVSASNDTQLNAAVATINAGRTEAYKAVAAKTGVSEVNAAQAAAQQVISRLPAGYYYRPIDGGWTRK
ncbi:YdbL family protein [Caulobacter sp. KR2-114]|uniref:YdbL family protein n=1 Tax=Caulobacter sp. KR2-114 TaxID=3400912 RepID=UPI003BFA9EE1